MKIVIREKADADLDDILSWIKNDNPHAAAAIVRRIRERVGRLASPALVHMGRPGRDEGTRELVIAPYIIVYEVHEDRGEVVVLSVIHGARNRETRDD